MGFVTQQLAQQATFRISGSKLNTWMVFALSNPGYYQKRGDGHTYSGETQRWGAQGPGPRAGKLRQHRGSGSPARPELSRENR